MVISLATQSQGGLRHLERAIR